MNEAIPITPADLQARITSVETSSRRLETAFGNGRTVWRIWGSGPALVLLHGGHGSWTHWLRTIPALAPLHTVIVPDMPGYGDSDPPPQETPECLAELLARGLSEIVPSPESIAVVGFSFGATVGGFLVRREAHRVRRFVLVGASALGLPAPPREPLGNWRRADAEEERMSIHRDNLGKLMIHDRSRIDALAVHLQSRNAERTRFRSVPFASGDGLRVCLEQARVPIAGIWGEEDATAKGGLAERKALLRRLDSHAPFEIIERAGHWVQYEVPDEFDRALLRVLDPRAGARGS